MAFKITIWILEIGTSLSDIREFAFRFQKDASPTLETKSDGFLRALWQLGVFRRCGVDLANDLAKDLATIWNCQIVLNRRLTLNAPDSASILMAIFRPDLLKI